MITSVISTKNWILISVKSRLPLVRLESKPMDFVPKLIFQRKTMENVSNLNKVFKKFEETKDLPKLDDFHIMAPNDNKTQRTPRLRRYYPKTTLNLNRMGF